MVPGILIALIDLGFGGQFWWIVILYFLIAQVIIDNFILIPILISRFSNLHPLWVIIAIIIGGKIFGVIGMIIGAVPLIACFLAGWWISIPFVSESRISPTSSTSGLSLSAARRPVGKSGTWARLTSEA